MKRSAPALLACLALMSCAAVGPQYAPPVAEVPARFVGGGSTAVARAASEQWWLRLREPLLNELIARGDAQNLDIRTAVERIRAAQAALGRTGVNAQTRGDLGLAARRSRNDDGEISTRSGPSADASYVFDLFGGIRRGREQAIANYQAAQLDTGTVRLAYLSDLVNSYVEARYYQEAAAITRATIDSRRRTLTLVNRRRDVEEATELEVQQARALLSTVEASLPFLIANFEANVFHIATLLAEPAGPILARMQGGARQPRPHGFTFVGIPADLVRNRPDVRFAERNLAAATAAIGVAEAQLYPSLQLGGSVTAGTDRTWSFGPFLSLPILNRGVLQANRETAFSGARQAQLGWRSAVLTAIEEVQTAMTFCRNWARQVSFLERATTESNAVLGLARDSYAGGTIILTDVLDAERASAANRLSLALAIRDYTVSWMQVQVATGKGWLATPAVSPLEGAPPDLRADPLGVVVAAR